MKGLFIPLCFPPFVYSPLSPPPSPSVSHPLSIPLCLPPFIYSPLSPTLYLAPFVSHPLSISLCLASFVYSPLSPLPFPLSPPPIVYSPLSHLLCQLLSERGHKNIIVIEKNFPQVARTHHSIPTIRPHPKKESIKKINPND